jgi:hypothetical protein
MTLGIFRAFRYGAPNGILSRNVNKGELDGGRRDAPNARKYLRSTMIVQNRAVGAMFLILALAPGPTYALECPLPQMESSDGILKQTPATIIADSQILAARGSAAIPGMVYRLRRRHPQSSNAAVLNYMVTAYCPVVNRMSAISDNKKDAVLARFESQVMARLTH